MAKIFKRAASTIAASLMLCTVVTGSISKETVTTAAPDEYHDDPDAVLVGTAGIKRQGH